jgi:uncharacterized protein YecE (DUF72 family)
VSNTLQSSLGEDSSAQPSPSPNSEIYAGTSGWAYPTWKPGFYPPKLPAKKFLEFYASRLTAVEVNYTFRALPTTSMLEGWLASTGEHFRFGFKAPQKITHFARLVNCGAELDRFFASLAPAQAAGRLGPVLFQLPPNFKADPDRLAAFLDLPPVRQSSAPRIAFEFRHQSWFEEPIYDLLRSHNAALCIAEGDELATPEVQCAANFACYRLRRSGGYSPEEIASFAERFTGLAASREVFVFFRHEDEPTGALNAAALLEACRTRSKA